MTDDVDGQDVTSDLEVEVVVGDLALAVPIRSDRARRYVSCDLAVAASLWDAQALPTEGAM